VQDCLDEGKSVLGDPDAARHLLHKALAQVGELLGVLDPLATHLGKQPVVLRLISGKMVLAELAKNAVQHRLLLRESAETGPIGRRTAQLEVSQRVRLVGNQYFVLDFVVALLAHAAHEIGERVAGPVARLRSLEQLGGARIESRRAQA